MILPTPLGLKTASPPPKKRNRLLTSRDQVLAIKESAEARPC